jgi:hypothetical protein
MYHTLDLPTGWQCLCRLRTKWLPSWLPSDEFAWEFLAILSERFFPSKDLQGFTDYLEGLKRFSKRTFVLDEGQ